MNMFWCFHLIFNIFGSQNWRAAGDCPHERNFMHGRYGYYASRKLSSGRIFPPHQGSGGNLQNICKSSDLFVANRFYVSTFPSLDGSLRNFHQVRNLCER